MSSEKRRFSVTLTSPYLEALDQLVEKGIYMNQQEAIRDALRRIFQVHRIAPFYKELAEKRSN